MGGLSSGIRGEPREHSETFFSPTNKEWSLSPKGGMGEYTWSISRGSGLNLEFPCTGYMYFNFHSSNTETVKSHLGL